MVGLFYVESNVFSEMRTSPNSVFAVHFANIQNNRGVKIIEDSKGGACIKSYKRLLRFARNDKAKLRGLF